MPASMTALVCDTLGGPEAMAVRDVAIPTISAGQVLIETSAWGLNYADALMSRGQYQTRLEPPFVAGCEVAGTITEVAPDVRAFRVGDRVAALSPGGGFAERVAVDAHRVLPMAAAMDFATGAGFYAGYATAAHALRQRGALQAGETMLVLAAGGGTGLAAVDIGRALGARVIAVAGSSDKLTLASQRGADIINYREEDVADAILRLSAGEGIDVVFDPVGGDLFDIASRRVRWNGRYLVVGFASGRIPKFAVNLCLVKGYAMIGVFTDDFMRREPALSLENADFLNRLYEEGRLTPEITQGAGIETIASELARVEQGAALGKLVVRR